MSNFFVNQSLSVNQRRYVELVLLLRREVLLCCAASSH